MDAGGKLMNTDTPVIVFGEGSASIFLIDQLLKKNESIVWVSGSTSHLLPVMPYVKSPLAAGALLESQAGSDAALFAGPVENGTFHRVFRNKGFKLPSWKRTANLESQRESFAEMVWAPEQAFLGVEEVRIKGLTPIQAEEALRLRFENHPQIKKVQNAPVVEFEVFANGGKIQFANGFITEFKQFFFCDSLAELKAIPKLLSVYKHQISKLKPSNQVNALQVVFHHSAELKVSKEVGYVVPMNRDSGETFDRDAMGYFMADGRSVWTVFLQSEECEENHDIMKKLRKLKQSLNRAFDSPEFLPEGKKDLLSTISKEQFRFEESVLFTEGELKESSSNLDFVILPDSFGITKTLEMIASRFEIAPVDFIAEGAAVLDESALDLDEVVAPSFAQDLPV